MTLNSNFIVEKSRYLLGMKAPSYELGELKLLDTYLSRIDARNPVTRLVKFTKKEYENLMGFSDSRPDTLKKITDGLLSKIVTLPTEKGWRKYTLFSFAECEIDSETGNYTIILGCNEQLEPFFFNINIAGYLQYKLMNILRLNSRYAVLLYLLLKDNAYRGNFQISLNELRLHLDANQKTYTEFKYFKRDVLDKANKEINSKTDIQFTFEKVMNGKFTAGIKFTIKELSDIENKYSVSEESKYPLLHECFTNFSIKEIEALYTAAIKNIPHHLDDQGLELAVIEYIKYKNTFVQAKTDTMNYFNRLYSHVLNNY